MKKLLQPEQIALPLGLINGEALRQRQSSTALEPNADLVGCSFMDGAVTISVVGVCHGNPKQVMVRRDPDGQSWSAPAWLIRVAIGQKKRRRRAA